MSLGVKQLWRFCRPANRTHRVSALIPRELASPIPPVPATAAYLNFSRTLFTTRAVTATSDGDSTNVREAPAAGQATESGRGAVKLWKRVPTFCDRLLNLPVRRHAASFDERLAKLPVRRHAVYDPVTVRPLNVLLNSNENMRSFRRYRKALKKQAKHDLRHHQLYRTKMVRDWRVILSALCKETPRYSHLKGVFKVVVPDASVEQLLSGRDNIWDIRSRTGCVMRLHNKTDQDPEDETYLLLSGSQSAVSRALKAITALADKVRVSLLTKDEARQLFQLTSPTLWRRDFSVHEKFTLTKPLDAIEMPEQLTQVSFERYVTLLTHGRMPTVLYKTLTPHEFYPAAVVRRLVAAFKHPDAQPILTLTSFKEALRYTTRFGTDYWNESATLFRMMVAKSFVDSEVYDMMARSAIGVHNLGFFQYIVNWMLQAGCPPTFQTWIHFLRLVKAEEIRRYIVRAMAEKNLFSHPSAMSSLANELVEHDTYRAIQLGLDFESFMAGQNELYGPEWLHHQTANKVLEAYGSCGRFDEMAEFLKVMFATPWARPRDTVALNLVLTHCKLHRRPKTAISFIKLFEENGVMEADHITYHLLIEMAYRSKKPHMLSIVWRCAHLNLNVSWRTLLRGRQALRSSNPGLSLTSRLKVAGVTPKSQIPRPAVQRWTLRQSNRKLKLKMLNLLWGDYKRAQWIGEDVMLTPEQVDDARFRWYAAQFDTKKAAKPLSQLLADALRQDQQDVDDSFAGKEVSLEPLPLETVDRTEDERVKEGKKRVTYEGGSADRGSREQAFRIRRVMAGPGKVTNPSGEISGEPKQEGQQPT